MEDFEETSLKTASVLNSQEGSGDLYLYIGSHPLLVYRMIRRFAEDLRHAIEELDGNVPSTIDEFLYAEDIPELPNFSDLDDALSNINRMQFVSELETSEVKFL